MRIVELPKTAVTRFDLPAVCVATGATEKVTYRKVVFSFVPRWARLSLFLCGLVGIIAMLTSTRRVRAELPFTDEAWAAWRRSKAILVGLLVVGAAIFAGSFLVAPDTPLLGLALFVALVVAAVVYSLRVARGLGPVCKLIDEQVIQLEIPSDEAATAIEARLGLGGDETGAPARTMDVDDRDALDARLQAELDALE